MLLGCFNGRQSTVIHKYDRPPETVRGNAKTTSDGDPASEEVMIDHLSSKETDLTTDLGEIWSF